MAKKYVSFAIRLPEIVKIGDSEEINFLVLFSGTVNQQGHL